MGKNLKILILFSAFLVRVILLIVDNNFSRLPQAGTDTENFHIWALEIYNYGIPPLKELFSDGVTMFSFIGAIIYFFFDAEPIYWAFILSVFSLLTINYTYKSAYELFGNYGRANLAASIVAFFPNMAILSVLTLREVPVHLLLSISFFNLIKYNKYNRKINLTFFFISTVFGIIFHSGIISLIASFFLVIILFKSDKSFFAKIGLVFFGVLVLYIINTFGIGLDKFGGSFESAFERMQGGVEGRDSGAVYPSWMFYNGSIIEIWKVPIRMIAILLAPLLPFMVKSPRHLIGVFDACFYFFLIYRIYKNSSRLNLFIYKFVMVFLLIFSLTFSFSGSNFGTNIRHRAKLLPIIAVLACVPKKNK